MDPVGMTNAWQSVVVPNRRKRMVTAHSARALRLDFAFAGRTLLGRFFRRGILWGSRWFLYKVYTLREVFNVPPPARRRSHLKAVKNFALVLCR